MCLDVVEPFGLWWAGYVRKVLAKPLGTAVADIVSTATCGPAQPDHTHQLVASYGGLVIRYQAKTLVDLRMPDLNDISAHWAMMVVGWVYVFDRKRRRSVVECAAVRGIKEVASARDGGWICCRSVDPPRKLRVIQYRSVLRRYGRSYMSGEPVSSRRDIF